LVTTAPLTIIFSFGFNVIFKAIFVVTRYQDPSKTAG
jgi:hypothetical protein